MRIAIIYTSLLLMFSSSRSSMLAKSIDTIKRKSLSYTIKNRSSCVCRYSHQLYDTLHAHSKRQDGKCQLVLEEKNKGALTPYIDCSLFDAASEGNVMLVQHLIMQGMDVNGKHPLDGETALHKAVKAPTCYSMSSSKIHAVHSLLLAGADPNIANHIGVKPIDMANDYQIKQLLCRCYSK